MNARAFLAGAAMAALALGMSLQPFAGQKALKIGIEEALAIGGFDRDDLLQWTGVASDAEGSIYVLDAMDYSLKKFDPLGRLLKKTGRKGEGPGEFLFPRLLDCSAKFVFVTDQNRLGIFVFDKELRYIKRIPLLQPVFCLRALSDEAVAVAVLGVQNPGKIVTVDGTGRVLSELAYTDKMSVFLMDSISFALDRSGNFYIAYVFQDRLEKRTEDGTIAWSKSLYGEKKVAQKKIGEFVVPTETCYKDIVLDSEGRVFVLGGNLSRNSGRDVYVLSPEGALLATFTLPDPSHCLYFDAKNFLYARADEGITLKKYRIRYD
jgi:hypothetical protein